MAKKAPGKAHREGLTIVQLMDMFPTEEAATKWFESIGLAGWSNGIAAKCGSVAYPRSLSNAKYMPYWCTDCRSYFSVKHGNRRCSAVENPDAEMGDCHLPVPDKRSSRFRP